jgi:hypothetical protein
MRLANIQFEFLPDGAGLKVVLPGKTKALARIVPDETYPTLWRVVRPNGRLSDMVNRTRAKDVAWGLAESAVFTGEAKQPESEPPFYGHFFQAPASPVRLSSSRVSGSPISLPSSA